MKKMYKRVVVLFAVMSFMLFGAISVQAKEYNASDINRIYVNSSMPLGSLTKENYVTAEITVVKEDGTIDFTDLEAGIKFRGNSTLKAEKKPFKIKLSSKKSVLGMESGKKWNVLANAFDKTLIRNKLGLDLSHRMGLNYISQSEFVDFYYNDEFLGSYLVTEPVEVGSNQVDIDIEKNDFMIELERERYESDVTYVNSGKFRVRFAINEPEIPSSSQLKNVENYILNVERAMSTHKMSEYSKYIDVDSFVNYYIVSELFKAVDFNYSSTRFYTKNGKMYAGPIWDVDLSSGNASAEFYRAYYNNGVSYKDLHCTEMKWFGELIKSDEFVAKVNARYKQMKNTIENLYKTNAAGTNQIDLLIGRFGKSFERNYAQKASGGAGWDILYRYSVCDNPIGLEGKAESTYSANVSKLRTWLGNRAGYLESAWKSLVNNKITGVTASKKTYNSISVTWDKSGIADGYQVYMKTGKGKYKLKKTISKENQTSTVIKKLKPGKTYRFKVRSYVKSSTNTQYSAFSYSKKTILRLKKPKYKIRGLGNGKIKITWKKVKGAKGYTVYMAKGKKAKYKKVATLKGKNKKSYIKKNLKSGKVYYFKVKSYVKYGKKQYFSK